MRADRNQVAEMVWGFGPGQGTMFLTAWVRSREAYDRVVTVARHEFDGQWATVDEAGSSPDCLFVRFRLDQPFRMPMTRLHFEDQEAARLIAETGVYAFDGQLWKAWLVEPGVLGLDRLFPTEPPPQYHGRTWMDHQVAEKPQEAARDRV